MTKPFEIGIITFGERTVDPVSGALPSPSVRLSETLQQAVLADEVGLDLFAVGEHHRTDFISSAPHMILAAAAAKTRGIHLSSGVTVLGSEDPVRVFQNFATLDLISGGRAEIIVGRGSYVESFPLFGYDLEDYAELFREKLDALLAVRADNPPRWSGGRFTADLTGLDIAPRPVGELPIWVGVGGTPASAVRTGMLGLPVALALLLGPIDQFVRAISMYRHAAAESGHAPEDLPVSINAHGFVGATSQSARDTMFPYFQAGMMENNHQRGVGFNLPRAAFDAQATARGALLVGSAAEIVEKLMTYHELYGINRAVFQMGFGGVPQREHLAAIERLGTEVAPVIRREIGDEVKAAA